VAVDIKCWKYLTLKKGGDGSITGIKRVELGLFPMGQMDRCFRRKLKSF
jgi:hypothetical protein